MFKKEHAANKYSIKSSGEIPGGIAHPHQCKSRDSVTPVQQHT